MERQTQNDLSRIRFFLPLWSAMILSFSVQAQYTFEWSEFESKANEVFRQHGSVGASVIVVSRDSVLFSKGFGYADLVKQRKVTDSTLFVLGSITKTFTALGILKLAEKGKLKLSDEVKKLAPELPILNEWENEYPLRVYHLLEHTSGFDELHLKDKSIPVKNDEFPLREGIRIARNSLKTRWKPGTRFAYSNVGYLTAGYLIEKVSGTGYNDFMLKEVLKPLGMKKSSIRLNEIDRQLLAKSYSLSKKERPFKHVFTRPTASLISSSEDMGAFLRVLLNKDKQFLSKEQFKEFEKHHSIQAFDETENGYRLGVYPRFHKSRKWLGHGGSVNKYNSEFEYSHEAGLGIFIVSGGPNATRTVDGILRAFHELMPEVPEKYIKPEHTAAQTDINSLEGYYLFTSPRNQLLYPFSELFTEGIFVEADGGNVIISDLGGRKSELTGTGLNKFSSSGAANEYQYMFEDEVLYTALGSSYRKTPFFLVLILAGSLAVSLSIAFLAQISLLIRLISYIRKKAFALSPLLTLEAGFFALLIGCILFLFTGTTENIHESQFLSFVLFLCTILFPLFTALGLVQMFKHRFKTRRAGVWSICLGVSSALLSSYLIYWGFFGFLIMSY